MGSRADVDAVAKRKNPCSCWELNPSRAALVTVSSELFRLQHFYNSERSCSLLKISDYCGIVLCNSYFIP